MVLPSKKINPHYAENQPEDKADQQHIHNGWDSAHQGVHNHLYQKGEERVSVQKKWLMTKQNMPSFSGGMEA